MEIKIDYSAVAEGLRARGHHASVEGGGGAAPLIFVGIARGRWTTWDGDESAWFACFVEADGDQSTDDPLELTSVTRASKPEAVADAISAALQGL